MAKAVFYHIYIAPKSGTTSKTLERKMDLALDWFKYDESLWIVYSTSDVAKWMRRLKPLVEPGGNLFICELKHTNKNGWMSKEFWKWFRGKKR